MSTDTVRTDVLGHEASVRYSQTWAGYAILLLRLAIGWVLFNAGVSRITDPTLAAADVFRTVPAGNPFQPVWDLIGEPLAWLLGPLVLWSLAIVGTLLIFGAFVRLAAIVAGALLILLWARSLPLGNAVFVDEHVVYLIALFSLCSLGAGRIAGLDAYFEHHRLVADRPWLRYLLG
ncbi:MAG: DoxX family protein [Halanaeroarchaeum sp.]